MSMEQQVAALQNELGQSQQHVARLAAALDETRKDTSTAIANLNRLIQEKGNSNGKKFISSKNIDPQNFTGKDSENYKEWAKHVKNYLNTQKRGFRKALEFAEKQGTEIEEDDVELMAWEHAAEADEALYDYLCIITSDRALILVEQTPERGFEAWRQLAKRHNPAGGQLELARMQHLLHRTACKSLMELPAAVDIFEKEIEAYNRRNPNPFPEEWKLPILLEVIPVTHRRELTMRYGMGERDYKKVRNQIVEYANESRVMKIRGSSGTGPVDMDVDNAQIVDQVTPEYTEDEYQAYAEQLEYELHHLGQKGKGKSSGRRWFPGGKGNPWNPGKGKGAGGKGESWAAAPMGKGRKGMSEVVCHWCKKKGHYKRDCRSFLAGRPKVTDEPRGAASLDGPSDWEDDPTDQEAVSLECMSLEIPEVPETNGESASWNMAKKKKRGVARCEGHADRCGCAAKFFPVNVLSEPEADEDDFISDDDANESEATVEQTKERPKFLEFYAQRNASPCSPADSKDETIGQMIIREQKEMKEQHAKLLTPPGLASPGGLSSMASSASASPSQEKVEQKKKKNRNQSAKKKLIQVLNEAEENVEVAEEKKYAECETQTDVSLPHTHKDVMWTPSSLDPVIEVADWDEEDAKTPEDHEGKDELKVGSTVLDLDSLDTETEVIDLQCFQKLLNDDEDETDRPLSRRATADLVQTNIIAEKEIAKEHRDECRMIEIHHVHRQEIVKEATETLEFGTFIVIGFIIIMILQLAIMQQPNKQNIEINTMEKRGETPEVRRKMRLRRGITMDSGAAHMVMPKRMIRNKKLIRPSPASRAGVHYVAANDGRIPNEGETDFKFKTKEGQDKNWKFQIAEVNKALGAISYLVGEGYRIVFEKDMKTGKDTSVMIDKSTN